MGCSQHATVYAIQHSTRFANKPCTNGTSLPQLLYRRYNVDLTNPLQQNTIYWPEITEREGMGSMYDIRESYRNIRLTPPQDEEYLAWMRRMADQRPTRGGRRSAGEYLGGLVERCVRHYIGTHVDLKEERILAWEQRLKNGRVGPMYRELDGVWQIDQESLCLFEMKLTRPQNMEKGTGIKQLNTAADILLRQGDWQYLLKRLVYVANAEQRVDVLDGIPVVEPAEEYEELGVIWVPLAAVEAAAKELEIELPENWSEPEAREGDLEDPERDSWKQYVQEEPESGDSETPLDNNPLAAALRKAMGGQ